MKDLVLTENAKACLYFVMATAVLTLLPVEAQAKLSTLLSNVGNEAPAMTSATIKLVALGGIFCVIAGVIGFMTRHKTQVPMGVCAGMFFGGIVLLGIIQFATAGLDTVFGSANNSGLNQIIGTTTAQ